jgi:hypothetical protein
MTMTKSMLQLAMLLGVITAVLGFTTEVHAATEVVCTATQCSGTIKALYPHPSSPPGGSVSVSLDGDIGNLTGCTPNGEYLVLSTSNPLFREFYELLLNAVTFNKHVFLSMTLNSNPCDIIYAVMDKP